MPIYEYECIPNKHRFEVFQKISDAQLKECRVCGGQVRKLISPTAFQLKGNGWYKDGYSSNGSGSKKQTQKRESSPASESAQQTKNTNNKEKTGGTHED